MPKDAIWSGAVSFGLVTVPVKLYPATVQKDIQFHQFKKGTRQRIRYKRVSEETSGQVDYPDIVKGYEVERASSSSSPPRSSRAWPGEDPDHRVPGLRRMARLLLHHGEDSPLPRHALEAVKPAILELQT